MPSAAAKNLACGDAGEFAVIVFDLTINDGEVDALRQLIGFCERSVVDDGCRIEDSDIREIAGLQEAATIEMFPLRGKRCDFANGGFEGQEMPVANVMSEKTRHGAHSAGMRMRFVRGTVKRHFIGVQ